MRSMLLTSLLFAIPSIASADFLKRTAVRIPSTELMAQLLQDREQDRQARPIGSCIFACGDRLIEVERCPDGTCPVFDCNARVQACPAQ